MSVEANSESSTRGGIAGMIGALIRLYERIPADLIAVLARVVVGLVFWNSARTKVDGFTIKPSTYFLFKEEYKVPLIAPEIAAYMATLAEHICPILLWIGLATRFSATALLIMTLVIQTFVYPGAYVTHGLWAVALLYLMANGPGVLSLDHLIRRGSDTPR